MFSWSSVVPGSGNDCSRKRCVVRLSDEGSKICDDTVDKLKGSSQKARPAGLLCQVDLDRLG